MKERNKNRETIEKYKNESAANQNDKLKLEKLEPHCKKLTKLYKDQKKTIESLEEENKTTNDQSLLKKVM